MKTEAKRLWITLLLLSAFVVLNAMFLITLKKSSQQSNAPSASTQTTNTHDWFGALPEVPKESQEDLRKTLLRAHYLNEMREQWLRFRQQNIDAELDARRIEADRSRINHYAATDWWCKDHGWIVRNGVLTGAQCFCSPWLGE